MDSLIHWSALRASSRNTMIQGTTMPRNQNSEVIADDPNAIALAIISGIVYGVLGFMIRDEDVQFASKVFYEALNTIKRLREPIHRMPSIAQDIWHNEIVPKFQPNQWCRIHPKVEKVWHLVCHILLRP